MNTDKLTNELILTTILAENLLKLSKSTLAHEMELLRTEEIKELKKVRFSKYISDKIKNYSEDLKFWKKIKVNSEKYNNEISERFIQEKESMELLLEDRRGLYYDLSKILINNISKENQTIAILEEKIGGQILIKGKSYNIITK